MNFDKKIFREYDIRGYAQDVSENITANLTPELALCIGKALGSRLKEGATVVVSGDHRDSTPALRNAIVNGYISTGVNVLVDNNPVPSAGNNWYLITRKLDGAVQVSGSHNPSYYNGIKISEGFEPLYGEELKKIMPVIEAGKYRISSKPGRVDKVDIVDSYIKMLNVAFPEPFKHPHRIILDAGSGLGGLLAPLLQDRGAEVILLFGKPDGKFPYHEADPSSVKATEIVVDTLKNTNKSIKDPAKRWYGILTDGDADRSGFIAEDGGVVWAEKMAAIFYRDYLQNPNNKGRVMALDVRASNAAMNIVQENGGIGLFIPAGYPSHRMFARLVSKDIGKDYPTGTSAEASGHFFFPTAAIDENGESLPHAIDILIDDGLYSALKLIYISDKFRDNCPNECGAMRELATTIPEAPSYPEIRLDCHDSDKFNVVDEIKERIKKDYEDQLKPLGDLMVVGEGTKAIKTQRPNYGIIEVDGVRAQFKDESWFLIRASNTVPMLTLKFEAQTPALLLQRMKEVNKILQGYSVVKRENLEKGIEFFVSE